MSLKMWSFYVDLEESIGTIEFTKAVYDEILSQVHRSSSIMGSEQVLGELQSKFFASSSPQMLP